MWDTQNKTNVAKIKRKLNWESILPLRMVSRKEKIANVGKNVRRKGCNCWWGCSQSSHCGSQQGESREMAPWSRALTAVEKGLGWIPRTQMEVHNFLSLISEELLPSSGCHGHCMVHRQICTHKYKISKNFNWKYNYYSIKQYCP